MVKRKQASPHSEGSPGHGPEHGRTFRYRNRTVELLDEPGHVHVKIDGEHLHAARIAPGSYHSHILMYQDFPSLESLARALIDTQGALWLPAGQPVGHVLAPPPKPPAERAAKKKKAVKRAPKPKRR